MIEPSPLNPTTHGPLIDKILRGARHYVDQLLSRPHSEVSHQLVDLRNRDFFITGGAICQLAFDMNWESDIDVFVPCFEQEEEHREDICISSERSSVEGEYEVLMEYEVDVIFKNTHHIQRVLRRFDISLCQIGLLFSAQTKSLTVFATPLFLCSLETHLCAVQVADISCEYLPSYGFTKVLEDRFRKHILFYNEHPEELHRKDFVSCKSCLHPLHSIYGSHKLQPDCHYVRWVKRVEKYQARFPDFAFHYYFARAEKSATEKIKKIKL